MNTPRETKKRRGFRVSSFAHRAFTVLSLIFIVSATATDLVTEGLQAGLDILTFNTIAILAWLSLETTGRFINRFGKEAVAKFGVFLDWLISFVCAIIYLFDLTKLNPKNSVDPDQTPILMVHGYLHNSSGWTYFLYRLRNEGYKNVFTINLGLTIYSMEHYADMIDQKAREIAEITGRDDLIIIAHSMGGMISSYWAANQNHTKVTDIITLASPLQGTTKAESAMGECARQMQYGSEFANNLVKQIQENEEIRFYHLGSTCDPTVRPNSSAFIPGKPKKIFDNLGHVMFLFSDEVIDEVADYLAA